MSRTARTAMLVACAGLLASLSTPSSAAQRRDESWGKTGISFLQYRTDAVECAYDAETLASVSIPQVDLTFMTDAPSPDAQPQMDPTNPNLDPGVAVDYAAQSQLHMNKTWREVARQLDPALTACLKARGYQRIRLGAGQVEQLKRLPPGTRARQVYLWNLAVDPSLPRLQAR